MSQKFFLFIAFLLLVTPLVILTGSCNEYKKSKPKSDANIAKDTDSAWTVQNIDSDETVNQTQKKLILYGQDLIAYTAKYFGPKGSVKAISNGMNCQNCHLDAGTRPWGNNFAAVYSTYPRFQSRSNAIQDIFQRINDCFKRSLNGKAVDTNSTEMKAMYAYMKWIGEKVKKGETPKGSALPKLHFLNRAADTQNGKLVYTNLCKSCHQSTGEGLMDSGASVYIYPPLWGDHSYNDGAGLFRISNCASFIKNNMPFNATTHSDAVLTDEQAWDVAAYINSQPRPHYHQAKDYPDVTKKPFDDPSEPFGDAFSYKQHKYGPYQPIVNAKSKK